jgi:hypothetical protein
MRLAAILIGIVILSAWTVLGPTDRCPIDFPTDAIYLPATAPQNGRRVYLFPGLDVNVSADFGSGPLKEMVDRLRGWGADVVLLPLPAPRACMFADGGARYRERFAAAVFAMTDGSRENIVGGVSYGGLHAMMAAATSDRFAGWFALLPVTRLDALAEFPGLDVPQFNPLNETAALGLLPGFLEWGTADDRVNWHLTSQLADHLKNVRKTEYPGHAHETTQQNIDDLMAWISTQ